MLSAASTLCGYDNPFEAVNIVKETNYEALVTHCEKEVPYFLTDIPEFKSLSPKSDVKKECYAAIAISMLLDPMGKAVWNDNELIAVICEGCIVLKECQMFAAAALPAWLCSTTLLPDVLVYPTHQAFDQTVIDQVQHESLPIFIAKYYSKDILQTARQLAIKLCILYQLYRSYSIFTKKLSGIVLPSLGKEDCTSQVGCGAKEIAISKQNVAIKVIVQWNCESLQLNIKYRPLKKDDVAKSIKHMIRKGRRLLTNFSIAIPPSDLFFQLTDEELDVLKGKILYQLQLKRENKILEWKNMNEEGLVQALQEYGIKEYGRIVQKQFENYTSKLKKWKNKQTIIEQCSSSISFVFKLQDRDRKNVLFLKSFARKSSENALFHIESSLSSSKIVHSLLSMETVSVSSLQFFVFEGLCPISREKAKSCLIEFLCSVKDAIDELHMSNTAHLDIRLPNICIKKASSTAVLIDLERCEVGIKSQWSGNSNSCMYIKGYSLEQIDHLQVYWMTYWILSYPAELDYHKMHIVKVNESEFEHEALCKTIFSFIQGLAFNFSPNDWEHFIKIIKSSGLITSSLNCE